MPQSASERILLLAPSGRDSRVACNILMGAKLQPFVCASLPHFVAELAKGVGVGMIADEALWTADLNALARWVNEQPAWSDLPFVVLTKQGGHEDRNPTAVRLMMTLGNVTFLERPFHPTTLISVIRSALRSRRRQYDACERLTTVQEARAILEQRVQERTAALKAEMEARETAQEQLRQAQKLETIGQLVGGVAHDFNNLLAAVIGNLDILSRRLPNDSRSRKLLDGAMQGARRGADLTQRLLAFARRQDLQPQATDTLGLVNGMLPLIERSLGPTVKIKVRTAKQVPAVKVDPNQLEMALLNLALNSRDAMPEGGNLTIELIEAEMAQGNEMSLPCGSYVCLSVRDTGAGMDEATLKRAIEPFFSTKGVGKGTGLGLSMVHGMAAQSGGAFKLESLLGVGTTAELWLPVADSSATRAAKPSAYIGPMPKATILVVDDDALVATSTADMLEDLGHVVVEANTGYQAIAALENGLVPDLVITDHVMPGMKGTELAAQLRSMRPQLPILLATGYAELQDVQDRDFPKLLKPYTQAQLATEIAKLLQVN